MLILSTISLPACKGAYPSIYTSPEVVPSSSFAKIKANSDSLLSQIKALLSLFVDEPLPRVKIIPKSLSIVVSSCPSFISESLIVVFVEDTDAPVTSRSPLIVTAAGYISYVVPLLGFLFVSQFVFTVAILLVPL